MQTELELLKVQDLGLEDRSISDHEKEVLTGFRASPLHQRRHQLLVLADHGRGTFAEYGPPVEPA